MKTVQGFFVVVGGRHQPQVHASLDDAMTDAKNKASIYKAISFYVCTPVAGYVLSERPEQIIIANIPNDNSEQLDKGERETTGETHADRLCLRDADEKLPNETAE